MISYEVGWNYNGTQSNLLRSTFSFAGFLLRDQPNYVTKQPTFQHAIYFLNI